MKIKTIYIIIILASISLTSKGQKWGERRYDFYYGAGLINFMGDIGVAKDQFIWVEFFETVSPTIDAGLRYNFNGRQYVNGSVFMGQMYAKDHTNGYAPGRKHQFNSFYTEIALKYEFLIIKEREKKTVYKKLGETGFKNLDFPTYLFAGAAGVMNVGATNIIDGYTSEKYRYFNVAPVVIFGFGFKYNLNKYNAFNLEAGYRLAINDKLDNAYVELPVYGIKYGAWYDSYQTITINYVHKLPSKRNGMPKFKRY